MPESTRRLTSHHLRLSSKVGPLSACSGLMSLLDFAAECISRRILTSMVPTADVCKSSNPGADERMSIDDSLSLEEPMQFLLH
jgi:hypothetical protein